MNLIDKIALVAEIERRLSLLENGTGDSEVMKRVEGVIKGYKSILSFLDTLEVKEVDLEEEIGRWMDKLDDKYCIRVEDYSTQDIKDTARHFFELGLKAFKN